METDWQKLRTDYLQTPISLRRLAEQNGISPSQLQKRASREHWHQQKLAMHAANEPSPSTADPPRHAQQSLPPVAPPLCDADRQQQLQSICDRLTAQLARATDELNLQVLRHKRRTREMTYDDPRGKPVEETTEEREQLEMVDALVDSLGLQRLSASLKILLEVSRLDKEEEQGVGLVVELMKKLDTEAERGNSP